MSVVDRYLAGLESAYRASHLPEEWDRFIEQTGPHAASSEEIEAIRTLYPLVPETLLELLFRFNGSNTTDLSGGGFAIGIPTLSSSDPDGTYSYYLLSAREIVENTDEATYLHEYIDRKYEGEEWVTVDPRIGNNSKETHWLHFADCTNNGGTSQLFIDFSPSPSGTVGQIVRYVHDPDELMPIADSFEKYLCQVIDDGFVFVNEW
ncbi:MAG: SMI1/KNR4 family protein [Actinomycetaceae bacterium]|nr:SMI1/KNR4 family protein [Actinomycetaceae bacterium]